MPRVFSILTIFALLFAVSACAPKIANRGNIVDPDRLAEIKVGESTRADVADKLGTPSQTATFDEKTWYYVGRQTEQYSFFDPKIVQQQAVQVKFDDAGKVISLVKLDPSDARDNVDPVDRRTPTYGHETTILENLMGNLAHPSISTDNKPH